MQKNWKKEKEEETKCYVIKIYNEIGKQISKNLFFYWKSILTSRGDHGCESERMADEGKPFEIWLAKRRIVNHVEINSLHTVHTAETVGPSPLLPLSTP